MPDQSPSLALLLELVQAERDKQLAHFDALDAKAGLVLGFAGLLVTLAQDLRGVLPAVALLAAVVAGSFALAAYWPRSHPILRPTPLRRYLAADERFTQLTVLDTLEVIVNRTSVLLEHKARRLRVAMVALAAAVVLLAAGILTAALTGGAAPEARMSPVDNQPADSQPPHHPEVPPPPPRQPDHELIGYLERGNQGPGGIPESPARRQ